ncbi:MAG: Threonine synthase [Lentisphaerae bacterium ADurb.Bin082]|nr:MAG: Threonine synthase [Lentisphaerae bacterium ADurb.Bin082]
MRLSGYPSITPTTILLFYLSLFHSWLLYAAVGSLKGTLNMSETNTYISTRGGVAGVDFLSAVMMGLADDGGLLLPASLPDVRERLDSWRSLAYPELAAAVMADFVGDTIPADVLLDLLRRSYSTFTVPEVVPIVPCGNLYIAELFHGPTLAFKDIALQFLGNLFEYILGRTGGKLNILGATSGDTGSAAIHGVRGKAGIDIFIMFPDGRVSPLQERQMTTVPDRNVHCIAVEGTFDDGQRVLKEIFNDLAFKRQYHLGAVNSVNWARVLAQVVYYFWAAFRVREQSGAQAVQVAVPTGNFGDIFAGYIALRMGAPIERLILATNENDILSRFFNRGDYSLGTVSPTLSPSMDIQVASNFERYLYYRIGEDSTRVRDLMATFARDRKITIQDDGDPVFAAGRGDTAMTLDAIQRYHKQHGYILDPHTAVGVAVAESFPSQVPTICLATAHPAKFSAAITQALGADLAKHPALEALKNLPVRRVTLKPEKSVVQAYMAAELARR